MSYMRSEKIDNLSEKYNSFSMYLLNGDINKLSNTEKVEYNNKIYAKFPEEIVRFFIDSFIVNRCILKYMTIMYTFDYKKKDINDKNYSWKDEIRISNNDKDEDKRELTPVPIGRIFKISNKLINFQIYYKKLNSFYILLERISNSFIYPIENNIINGNGNCKPLGMCFNSIYGIDSREDIIKDYIFDDIIMKLNNGALECKYSLIPQYREKSTWVFNFKDKDLLLKLKDLDGCSYFYDSDNDDKLNYPDKFLGIPIVYNDYINIKDKCKYFSIVGDLSYYWFVFSNIYIRKLEESIENEEIFLNDQSGYEIILFANGMPVLPDSFKRLVI